MITALKILYVVCSMWIGYLIIDNKTKKMKKFLGIMFMLLVASCGLAIAQDSTAVNVVKDLLPAIEGKFTFIPYVLGALFAVSEALSLVPSVKANGIFQLVFGWLKAIQGK